MDQPSNGNLCSFHVFLIVLMSLISRLLGIGTTLLIPETKRKTLEELTGEHELYNPENELSANNGKGSPTGSYGRNELHHPIQEGMP